MHKRGTCAAPPPHGCRLAEGFTTSSWLIGILWLLDCEPHATIDPRSSPACSQKSLPPTYPDHPLHALAVLQYMQFGLNASPGLPWFDMPLLLNFMVTA
jgi:hypothetical protein